MANRKLKPDAIPKLTKKLDAVFSRFVRLSGRDRFGVVKCYTCDHRADPKTMQAGHWIPRQHRATRWELWNVKPQCYACNMRYGGRPQEFRERMVEEYGEEEVQEMALRRHDIRQWTREELKDLIEYFTDRVKELEGAGV